MDSIWQQILDRIDELLVELIMFNLSNTFSSLNTEVSQIASDVGMTPAQYLPGVFSMVRNLSENVIMPVAGVILTFVACYELIQLIMSHNNLANFETWIFFKWIMKTFVAVTLISNTFNITMAIFDLAQEVIQQSGGLINGATAIDDSMLLSFRTTLVGMQTHELLALMFQTTLIQCGIYIMAILIFVVINTRMIEIYLWTSLAPIPFATFGTEKASSMGMNYLYNLFALAFQGFLIMVCVAIYSALLSSSVISGDVIASLWKLVGITVLLCLMLFKTRDISKAILHAH